MTAAGVVGRAARGTGPRDLVLLPGEFAFAGHGRRLRTLLGSCVAITWWHPRLLVGAMCHFMVPARGRRPMGTHGLDGHYADEAVQLFCMEAAALGVAPDQFVAKVFGGGRQFITARADASGLPDRNVEAALNLLGRLGIPVSAQHVGGWGHRQIVFDVACGSVWVRHEGRGGPPPVVQLPVAQSPAVGQSPVLRLPTAAPALRLGCPQ